MSERSFSELFGRDSDVRAEAPGRVNLIGEHTDYSGGYVLPTVIPQKTRAELARREDRRVRAWSREIEPPSIVEYELGSETPRRDWLDYVQGITRALAQTGESLAGFDLAVRSDVPLGSGLSSSAALEISLLRALRSAFDLRADDVEIARIGRRAENEFVGAPVGIMDQMASSLAEDGIALFVDTRSLEFERIPIPPSAEIVVIDSGLPHRHAEGEYRTRRKECEEAAKLLGVAELRDVGAGELSRIERLPPVLARRARHVVTENDRVLKAVEALRSGDLARLGRLLDLSHESLKSDFEVSIPEIDRLVALAQALPEVYGARMTGGGFGGSIVVLARRGAGRDVGERVVSAYGAMDHPRARVIVPP